MPRPKPNKEQLLQEYIFSKGLVISLVDTREEFNCNTPIYIQCKIKVSHSYQTTITKIRGGQDIFVCPHCIKEKENMAKGLNGQFVKNYCNSNNLDYSPKKDSYVKWEGGEIIKFYCLTCGKFLYKTESLRHWEEKIAPENLSCIYCHNPNEVIQPNQNITLLKEEYDIEDVPLKFREKLLTKPQWRMITYKNSDTPSQFQCIKCGDSTKMVTPHNLFVNRHDSCLNCNKFHKHKEKEETFLKADNKNYDF